MKVKKTRIRIPQVSKIKAELQKENDSKCPFCSNTDVGHFEIHHIDGNPSNNKKDNLILLCPLCHSKITKGDISQNEVINAKTNLTHLKNKISVESLNDISINDIKQMAKIPAIYSMSYPKAKELLIASGWIPISNHWSYGDSDNIAFGNGPQLWEKGYWELYLSYGTGYANCLFQFKDIFDNKLTIITQGEIINDDISTIIVSDLQFFKNSEVKH